MIAYLEDFEIRSTHGGRENEVARFLAAETLRIIGYTVLGTAGSGTRDAPILPIR